MADNEPMCKHGVALDVHCCGCHSGFLFDCQSCSCLNGEDDDEGEDYGDESDEDLDQCQSCGAHLFTEPHAWDCPYADTDEEDL